MTDYLIEYFMIIWGSNNSKKSTSYWTLQIHGFAHAIEISGFFRDLIFMDASEMNNIVQPLVSFYISL
jgi:hypothetical protein